MGHLRSILVAVVGAVSLVGAGSVSVLAHEGRSLVEFDSMTGVTAAGINVVNDRGITAGGKPWVITSGRGEVDRQGNVHVQVRGLVIPVAPFNGTSPVKIFRATVSCLTPHGVVNVTTGTFPTGSTGDATISGTVALPHPCKDPIVFVVNGTASADGTFAWFAMSNGEDED
jgi:hypothetical protein